MFERLRTNLKFWIQATGMTVADFCRKYSLGRRTVDRWFDGTRSPTLAQIAKVETSIDWLLESQFRPVFPFFVKNVSREQAEYYETILKDLTELLRTRITRKSITPFVEGFGITQEQLAELFQDITFTLYLSLFFGIKPPLLSLKIFETFREKVGYSIPFITSIYKKIFWPEMEDIKPIKVFRENPYTKEFLNIGQFNLAPETSRFMNKVITQFSHALDKKILPLICFPHLRIYFDKCPICKSLEHLDIMLKYEEEFLLDWDDLIKAKEIDEKK